MALLNTYCFLLCLLIETSTCLLLLDDDIPCQTRKYLNDTDIRKETHKVTKDFLCDDKANGWYRFQSGEIATSCVPNYHGSKNTVWMDDTLPSVQDGTQLKKFCANFILFGDDPDGKCCDYTYEGKVVNCGTYFVYFLQGYRMQCPMVYVTSDIKPCGPDKTSRSGFEPCTDKLPENVNPNLLGPFSTDSDFYFKCEFNYTTSLPTIGFNVTWRFDDAPVYYEIVAASSQEKSVSANNTLWTGNIGKKLSCSVQPFSNEDNKTTYGTEERSNEYFGGIQIEPKDIVVSEGTYTELNISSTLPILCNDTDQDAGNCSIELRIKITSSSGVEDLLADRCRITLDASSVSQSSNIRLSVSLNPAIYPNTTHSLEFDVGSSGEINDMWDSYIKSSQMSFTVTTQHLPHSECLMFPFGHIFGFGKHILYTMNYPGDFLIYETPVDSDSTLVVHGRHKVIKEGQVASLCGVAMQYGPDIVFVDMCEYDSVPVMTMNNTDNKLTIYECGPHEFHIFSSDGVSLEVQLYDLDLAVKVHLPPGYSNKGQGLCSYVHPSGNLSLTYENIKQYRLSYTDSLFGMDQFNNFATSNLKRDSYCNCMTVPEKCSLGLDVNNALTQKIGKCEAVSVDTVNIRKKGRRIEEENFHPKPFSWPTPSGHTQKDTLAECHTSIATFPPTMCMEHLKPFLNLFEHACSVDVQLTDTFDSRLAVVQGFTWLCQASVLADPSSHRKQGNVILAPPAVTSQLCPRFCSFNGTCTDGVCTCQNGNSGDDCSVKELTGEVIVGIVGGLTCTNINGGCLEPTLLMERPVALNSKPFVHVTPFYERRFSVDAYTVVKLIDNGFEEGKRVKLKEQGEVFLTVIVEYEYGISVRLSEHQITELFKDQTAFGFSIFVLTDQGMSNTVNYVVYDEKCRRCYSPVVMCTIKEKSCHIDDKCYEAGELNPTDSSKKCDPYKALLHWTDV